MEYQYDFSYAGVSVRWKSSFYLKPDARYLAFQKEITGQVDVQYEILCGSPERNPQDGRLLFRTELYEIREDAHYRYRIFPYESAGEQTYIVLERELESKSYYRLYIPQEKAGEFVYAKNWSLYLAYEEMFMYEGRILLHASYVETKEGAVLFCGPSGIGKSTQAELWVQSGLGRLINGDRAVVYEDEGRIFASGSPYAGSSRLYLPYYSQVRAVVILNQGEQNQVHRLTGRKSVLPLLEESAFGFMDETMQKNQAKIVLDLAEKTPVYMYTCTDRPDAVDTLYRKFQCDRI